MQEHSPSLPPEVIEALHDGRTIEAIKRLRESTGMGLKEAKDAVDRYRHENRVELRVKNAGTAGLAPGETSRSGSGIIWLAVLILAAVLAYFFLRNS